jgi:hypothetical protein
MNTTSPAEATACPPAAHGIPPVTYADEARVAAFVAAHKLEEWVEAAIRLARDAFPRAERITLRMFGEPGEYGERLILDVTPGVAHDDGERQYHDFVQRWIDETPPQVTDRIGIALTHS